jgi:hypothetical protein
MASYDAEESSVENSQPFEIYRFLLGAEEFLYTSTIDEQVVDSKTYVPAEIQRAKIAQGKNERTRVLTVDIGVENPLAQRYVGPPPGQRAALSIFRVQRGDVSLTPALIYSGTVKAVTFPKNGNFANMQVQSIEASSSRAVPRFTYMGMCNHVLYDTACGVLPAGFTHTGAVTLVSSNQITVSGLNASGLNFVGGYADSSTGVEKRQVLVQSGDVITVLLPFEEDPLGTSISVLAGCNKVLKENCAVIFGNEINFGGFAFVPKRNPFTAGL